MKKKILAMVLTSVISLILITGCGGNESENQNSTEEKIEQATNSESESTTDEQVEEDNEVKNDVLPEYEYPGPELFYSVLYDYILTDKGQYFDDNGVKIPSVNIIYQDESNKDDILVYGDFWVYTYTLNDQTLECEAGGDFPGLIHMASDENDGYKVTKFEVVEDGSNFDESAKEIFGDYYDEFMKLSSDSEAKEAVRAQIIANYVFANGLNIIQYKDYGWDPVELPEQNIDTFYSDL